MKKLAKVSASSEKGKKAVTLRKAPFEIPKKANEATMIDEAVKVGNMRLSDGSTVKITKEDAQLMNQMFKDLNAKNRKTMESVMKKDKAGFKEILGFAREAL